MLACPKLNRFALHAAFGRTNTMLARLQSFAGKLVELPKVDVTLLSASDEKERRSIPLERIAALQRTLPASSLGAAAYGR